MWQSKNETIRRLRDEVETLRANESARSILPMRSMWIGDDLDAERQQRAASLQTARIILGDITTEELLDAADFIDSGTRYDEDGEEIKGVHGPARTADFSFDEWASPEIKDLTGWSRRSDHLAGTAESFRAHEKPFADKVADRVEQTRPAWQALINAAYAGSDDRLPRRTPGEIFNIDPAVTGKMSRDEAYRRYGMTETEKERLQRPVDTAVAATLAEEARRTLLDRTALVTPHSAPLVPLSEEAAARLEELRKASAVTWADQPGEETKRVTTTPLVPITEDEDDETGPLPDSTVDDGEHR